MQQGGHQADLDHDVVALVSLLAASAARANDRVYWSEVGGLAFANLDGSGGVGSLNTGTPRWMPSKGLSSTRWKERSTGWIGSGISLAGRFFSQT
jgi:hypothetical protein